MGYRKVGYLEQLYYILKWLITEKRRKKHD